VLRSNSLVAEHPAGEAVIQALGGLLHPVASWMDTDGRRRYRLAPGQLALVGRSTSLWSRDLQGDWRSRARLWEGDLIGLWGLIFPDEGGRELILEAVNGDSLFVSTAEAGGALLGAFPPGSAGRRLLERLALSALIAAAPSLGALGAALRRELVPFAEIVSLEAGQSLYAVGKRPQALTVLGPIATAEIQTSWGSDGPILMQHGSLLGVGGLSESPKAYNEGAIVRSGGRCARLRPEPLRKLARTGLTDRGLEGPGLVEEVTQSMSAAERIDQSLRQSPSFAGWTATARYRLQQAHSLCLWRVGGPPPSPLGDWSGLCVVLSGSVVGMINREQSPRHAHHFKASAAPADVWRVGQLFAIDQVGNNPRSGNALRVREPARLAFIHAWLLEDAQPRAAARPALEHPSEPASVREALTVPLWWLDPLGQEAVLEQMPFLAGAVSEAIAHCFREKVGQVRLVRRGKPEALWVELFRPGAEPLVAEVPAPADAAAVRATVDSLACGLDLAGLLVWSDSPSTLPGGALPVAGVARRVYLNAQYEVDGRAAVPWPPTHLQSSRSPYVYVTLLPAEPDQRGASVGVEYPPATTRLVLPEGWAQRLPAAAPVEAVQRAIVAGRQAAARPPTGDEPAEVEAALLHRSLDRWARAVTDRRVGVALAGGEAWGAAHFVILEGLVNQNVPIDVITACSAGALFGSYFAYGGLAAIEKDVLTTRRLWLWQILNTIGVLDPRFFVRQINADMAPIQLESLEVPIIPVGTMLHAASASAVVKGSIGDGVLWSGSFVPFFPVAFRGKQSWVDGAYSDGLPVDILQIEGVRLVIASNVVAPPPHPIHPPRYTGPGANLIHNTNVVGRVKALLNATQVGIFTTGLRSALAADVSFQTAPTTMNPFLIIELNKIIADARANPALWDSLRGVVSRWNLLRTGSVYGRVHPAGDPGADPEPGGSSAQRG